MLTDVITYFQPPVPESHIDRLEYWTMITPSDNKHTQSSAVQLPAEQRPMEDKTAMPPPYSAAGDAIQHPDPAAASLLGEVQWQLKLKKLEKTIRKYNWTKKGDEALIVASMRDLAASHTDPQVQAYWTRRADQFEKAPDADKKALLMDIGRGLAILIAAPFAIAGALLMGTGMLLKASGNFLTGGRGSKFIK
ncbi:hypothetical protein DFH06DRAFT_219322 [Mycena polygramma]|nr:hypothetical protein DFH06DRAFT_219322 [Mycena polygramma]